MASFMEKMQVNTAITENTKLDLGHQHVTSIDMFELQPSMTKEMVPGERLDVKMESFVRLNPMPVPTFGRMSLRHRAFFVPYRTVFRGWNDFITDSVHVPSTVSAVSAIVSSVPTVDNATLNNAFIGSDYGLVDLTDNDAYEAAMASDYMVFRPTIPLSTDIPADILAAGADDSYSLYSFTTKGRQAIKVLESLGYKVIWNTMKSSDDNYINPVYSALPLLALAKIYTDWYWPTQYTNLASYDDLVSLCNRDNDNNTFTLTDVQVRDILKLCVYSQYDADMFTAAWDKPNSPTSGTYSTDFRLVNIDSIGQVFSSSTNTYTVGAQNLVTNNSGAATADNRLGGVDAPFITTNVGIQGSATNASTFGGISEYLLRSLHALTDYMKRHQLVGAKAGDRYLARFGKALSAEKMNRSVYLGAAMQDVQIGDVMSTADTEGANLGSYGGKGLSYGNGQFEYSTDEYGLFIVLTSLVPAVGYFQGIDRTVKHVSKLDFWTPEFDSLGSQAVAADELYVPNLYSSDFVGLNQQVFGYLPTYYEYKVKNDKVTGNFRCASINGINGVVPSEFNAANSWYLMRMFDDKDFTTTSNIVHSAAFVDAKNDMSQYKRIFYDTKASTPDNFTVIHNFEIASFAPMKSLFDSYEFEDKGKKVTEDVNGVKMN